MTVQSITCHRFNKIEEETIDFPGVQAQLPDIGDQFAAETADIAADEAARGGGNRLANAQNWI
jgi:hypothetical protein